ncbi:MAG TPA: patatin family protein, partial [Lachnospiraceae bacterium]|nr:patatin family protein [Lachnospiraceae bacterium]
MKLGLVIEGGGMKCAYTSGILDLMLDDGIKP